MVVENPERTKNGKYELLPQGTIHNRAEENIGNDDNYIPSREFIDFLDSGHGEQLAHELHALKVINHKGMFRIADVSGKYVNYRNGERFTVGNPDKYRNTVYLFGPCLVYGIFVDDFCTLGSYLRKKIDDDYYIKNLGSVGSCVNWRMREEEYKAGDIVIIFSYFDKYKGYYRDNDIKTYSLDETYLKMPDLQKNIWDNLLHVNKNVTEKISDELFKVLQKGNVFHSCSLDKTVKFAAKKELLEIPKELEEWFEKVSVYKTDSNNAGAIVMNCNPFTKGHRYLIETAAGKVDTLYIFVVEEDKSFFAFKDRLSMVSMGTSDLKNVIVIPSGKYMISTVTLPGYFNKEDSPYAEFDATDDLGLFGECIAKEFNIKIRFAGEEPNDIFTRHYNQEMARILPKYGIKFCEIPRKEVNGQVISATTVRECIKCGQWTKLKELVLPHIYEFLKCNYS